MTGSALPPGGQAPAPSLMEVLLAACPSLYDAFCAAVAQWLHADGRVSSCGIMMVVTDAVRGRLAAVAYETLPALFAAVEAILARPEVLPQDRDAVATCFLENLVNIADTLDPSTYRWMLGPASLAVCCGWDTG